MLASGVLVVHTEKLILRNALLQDTNMVAILQTSNSIGQERSIDPFWNSLFIILGIFELFLSVEKNVLEGSVQSHHPLRLCPLVQ